MRFTIIACSILVSFLAYSSCGKFGKKGGKDDSGPGANENVPSDIKLPDEKLEELPSGQSGVLLDAMDIGSAVGLGIVKSKSAAQGLTQYEEFRGQVVGIDGNGEAKPVSLVVGGNTTNIQTILRAGNYLYFVLNPYYVNIKAPSGESCQLVAMRITDHKLYCIPDVLMTAAYYPSAIANAVSSSLNGEVHFFEGRPLVNETFTGYPYVYTVDFSSGVPVVRTTFSKAGYTSERTMTADGDFAYNFYEGSSPNRTRVSKVNGGFQPLGRHDHLSCMSAGIGDSANDFYYFEGVAGNYNRIAKFRRGSEGLYTSELVREDTSEAGDDQPSGTNTSSFRCSGSATDTDRIVMVGTGTHESENKSFMLFLSIPSHQITRVEIPDIAYASRVLVGSKRIIIWGTDMQTKEATVVSYNKENGTFKTLLKQTAFDVSVKLQYGLTTVTPFVDEWSEGQSQVFEDDVEMSVTLTDGLSDYMTLEFEK